MLRIAMLLVSLSAPAGAMAETKVLKSYGGWRLFSTADPFSDKTTGALIFPGEGGNLAFLCERGKTLSVVQVLDGRHPSSGKVDVLVRGDRGPVSTLPAVWTSTAAVFPDGALLIDRLKTSAMVHVRIPVSNGGQFTISAPAAQFSAGFQHLQRVCRRE